MSAMASQITGVSIVYSTVCSGADQRKHQSSASLAFVRGSTIGRRIPRKVTRKMFPFEDVIMRADRHGGIHKNPAPDYFKIVSFGSFWTMLSKT